jgi:signal transduction histidine kinase
MKRFRDYRLRTKQAIIFGVILILMAGVEVFLMYRMTILKTEIDAVTSMWLPSAVASASIRSSASDLRNMQLQQAIARDASSKQRLSLVMVGLIEKIEENQDEYKALITAPAQLQIYDRYLDKWEKYQELSFDFFELVGEDQPERAVELLTGEGQAAFDGFSAVLDTLVLANETASADAASRAATMYHRARRISNVVLVVAVILAAVFATVLVRLITVPVMQLADAAGAVASGNLDVELDVLANDEIGDLSRSFNQMTASLRKARDQITSQQLKLREANEELGDKNRDLEEAMRQLRTAQEQLIMREKMASLGNLVAGVAHEINNPIGAVKSAADTSSRSIQLVCSELDGAVDLNEIRGNKRFQTALQILKNNNDLTLTASGRIAEIVKSLKSFARLDEAEFQDADVHEGLESTLSLLHHELKNRIEVRKNYGDIPKIPCYPNQLNQVFMNVLSNAGQAIIDRGVITITTKRHGDNAVITISDDGCGIDTDTLDRIFDPGFTTKGVGVGTGLGLSITYNIIKRHNGDIAVESEPGRGTTVTITLPTTGMPGDSEA